MDSPNECKCLVKNRWLRATIKLLNSMSIQTSDVDAEVLTQQTHSRVCEVISKTIINFHKERKECQQYHTLFVTKLLLKIVV